MSQSGNSNSSPASKKNNYSKAVNHWYGQGHLTKPNTREYYQFIRRSPVVEFRTNANVIRMLKQFGLGGNNSNYYKGRSTYQGAIFNQVPKHRKLYIMSSEPFRFRKEFPKGINTIPGMVKAWNQKARNTIRGERVRLVLVNKELMNRYIHKRSIAFKEKYTLENAKKLIKVAEKWKARTQAGKKNRRASPRR